MVDTLLAAVGIVVKEPWADDISYEMLNYTLWKVQNGGDGCGYVALKDNIGVLPDSDQTVWRKAVEAGQSIYDLAVKYGHFDGTEEEFEAQYQAALQAAIDAASATNATNEEIQSAEALRVEAEQNRVSAETSRVSAEESRASAELTRENDEQARRNNESGRSVAEESRATAEQNRVSAENSRVFAENNRANAEVDRRNTFEALEEDMETAIGQADAATAAASAINNQIVSAENDRVAAESGRVTAEGNRVTAEQGRADAETSRATAENGRVTAEESRVSAETSRATAETNRETRANTDHNTATSDHETAASDHNTAASDHTQAGTDHTRAESDHSRAEEDHAGIADKVSQEELAVAIEPLARKDGSYDTMSVGLAKNLEGRTNETDSFFERTTGGDAEVANGLAQMTEVGGNSVKFNSIPNTFSRYLNDDVATYSSDGRRIDVEWKGVAYYFQSYINAFSVIAGHKMYIAYTASNVIHTGGQAISGGVRDSSNNVLFYIVDRSKHSFDSGRLSHIQTVILSGEANVVLFSTGSGGNVNPDGDTISLSDFTVIDLTAIFGSGNEPETVEDFEEWLAENVGLRAYYPYTEPTVLNVNMAGIETVGRNLLDPTTGKARIIGVYSDVYGNYYGITGTHGAITFTSDMGEESTITPDEDGKFLLEEPGELSVADAGADCCVFLWWDGTQTDYVEHKDEKTYLDVTHIYGKLNGTGDLVRVWPTGMPKVNGLKDTLRIEDGQVVARRNLLYLNLGETTVSSVGGYGSNSINYNIANIKKANALTPCQIVCSKYPRITYSTSNDNGIGQGSNGYVLIVWDSSLASLTKAEIKAAMAGVKVYFEANVPEVYTDLVYQGSDHFDDGTPVTLPLNYPADNWGIERVLPLNTSEALATAKPELTCKYSIDAVETLNTHADEIEDLYDKNEELDAKKPNKTGDYPGMAVGSAKVLEGTDNKVEDFVFTAPQCADGIAKLNEVRGKSLSWNQLVNGAMEQGETYVNGIDFHISTTPYSLSKSLCDIYIPAGHKILQIIYLSSGMLTSGTITIGAYHVGEDGEPNSWVSQMIIPRQTAFSGQKYAYITQANKVAQKFWFFEYRNDLVIETAIDGKLNLIDLTLMFGAGNEPATVAEFEAMFPLPYYAYNEGKIKSNKTVAVEVTGRNLLDSHECIELAVNSYGNSLSSSSRQALIDTLKRLKRLNQSLYYQVNVAYSSTTGVRPGRLAFYSNGVSIKALENQNTFTLDDIDLDAVTNIIIYGSNTGSATFSNAIINISDPSFNGQYEQYEKNTVALNLPTLTGKLNGEGESVVVYPEGMRGAGTAYDKAAGKRGEVVMAKYVFTGNEAISLTNWRPADGTYAAVFAASAIPGFKITVSNAESSNSTLPGVDNKTYQEIYNGANGATLYNGTYSLVIRVPSSIATDNATLLAWLTGKEIIYELAEPLVYELDEGVPETFQAYKGGTLKQLPENGSEPTTAPCVMSVTYALDAVGILTGLPQNYISKESLQAMLTAMQSAGLFSSYTMTYNATTGKYEFTFTANS